MDSPIAIFIILEPLEIMNDILTPINIQLLSPLFKTVYFCMLKYLFSVHIIKKAYHVYV